MPFEDPTLIADSAATTDTSSAVGDNGAGGAGTGVADVGDDTATQLTEITQDTGTTTASTETGAERQTGTDQDWQITQPVTLPNEIRALMADKDLAQNPLVVAAIKSFQSINDRFGAITAHIPTVADAKKLSEAFPGGVQDALQAQIRARQLDESDNAYFSRDPQQIRGLAADWHKNDPEAYTTLVQEGLGVLAENNPDAYRQIGLDIVELTLQNMQNAAFRSNNQEAANRIAQVHQDIFGRKPGEQPRSDPRDAQYREREQAQQRREQEFQQKVSLSFVNDSNKIAGSRLSTAIEGKLKTALDGIKITPQARTRLSQDIYDAINQKLLADKGLDNRLKAIEAEGRRAGAFSEQNRQQWVNAIYSKAASLLPGVATEQVNRWTQDFLGVAKANNDKRSAAASRTDITGGGSPNLGMQPLTGDKILNMSDEDFRNYKGPIHPEWRKQMQEARFARK